MGGGGEGGVGGSTKLRGTVVITDKNIIEFSGYKIHLPPKVEGQTHWRVDPIDLTQLPTWPTGWQVVVVDEHRSGGYMGDTLITDKIFSALPIEAQRAFTAQWDTALNPLIARHGPVPDPEQREVIETLVKMFFMHGYAAALQAEKGRVATLRQAIEGKFEELIRR